MDQKKTKKVLVTGHDGYIGAVLVLVLLKEGYDVTGLDTFFFEDCWFTIEKTKLKILRKDVRDINEEDLKGFDAVIDLAALSNDALSNFSTDVTLDINYNASIRLAKFSKKIGIKRFLFASSCALYGKSGEVWMDENSPTAPITAYIQSKLTSEAELQRMADSTFTPIILRCATVFGVSPKMRFDLVVNNLVGWAVLTGKIQIMSDGTPWRPLIHVEDLAYVYEFLLRCPLDTCNNYIFNVGFNNYDYQIRTIAEQVAQALPGTETVFSDKPDMSGRSYRVRFDKFQSFSSMKPRWDLKSSIRQMAEACQQYGLTMEDFSGKKYVRIKQIQHLLKTGDLDSELRWKNSLT